MNATRFQFVLVETLQGGNVGAACRALKNNGFAKSLRLVRPPPLDGEATKMAWKSLDVLENAKRFSTLDDAIADCKLVIGLSARVRRLDRPFLDLDAAVPRIVAAARAPRGRVALLFGREDRGLTHDELEACSMLVRIDAAKERQVYNLAQAVLLVAYRLRREFSSHAATSIAPVVDSNLPQGVRKHLRERLRDALLALGYGELKDRSLLDRIVARSDRLLDRAGLEAPDVAMLQGILRRVESIRKR